LGGLRYPAKRRGNCKPHPFLAEDETNQPNFGNQREQIPNQWEKLFHIMLLVILLMLFWAVMQLHMRIEITEQLQNKRITHPLVEEYTDGD